MSPTYFFCHQYNEFTNITVTAQKSNRFSDRIYRLWNITGWSFNFGRLVAIYPKVESIFLMKYRL